MAEFLSCVRRELEQAQLHQYLVAVHCVPSQPDVFIVGYVQDIEGDQVRIGLVDPDGIMPERAYAFEIRDVNRVVSGSRYLKSLHLLTGMSDQPRVVEDVKVARELGDVRSLLDQTCRDGGIARLHFLTGEQVHVRPLQVEETCVHCVAIRFDDGEEDGAMLFPLTMIEEVVAGSREEITLRYRWQHRHEINLG